MKRAIMVLLGILLTANMAFGWGGDIKIYDGKINCFDVDYAMDGHGTMYVAFQVQGEDTIRIYSSTDHGYTWSQLTTVHTEMSIFSTAPRDDLSRIRLLYDEKNTQLFLFYVDSAGYLCTWKIPLPVSVKSGIRVSSAPILEGSFDVTYNLNNGKLFASWSEGNNANDKVYIVYSNDQGLHWNTSLDGFWGYEADTHQYQAYGPPNNLFNTFSIKVPSTYFNIFIWGSPDDGVTWPDNLKGQLTGNSYRDYDPHVCAANVNNSGVWVFYNRDMGEHEINLYYRYSSDAGANWSSEQTLSDEAGVNEYIADIKFYKDFGNPYVNMVYIYDDPSGDPKRKAIRAWTSTADPTNWRGNQVANDKDITPWPEEVAPKIIYSPGSSAPGGGVVFSYYDNSGLYFDAPWNDNPVSPPSPSGHVLKPAEVRTVQPAAETPDANPTNGTYLGFGDVVANGTHFKVEAAFPAYLNQSDNSTLTVKIFIAAQMPDDYSRLAYFDSSNNMKFQPPDKLSSWKSSVSGEVAKTTIYPEVDVTSALSNIPSGTHYWYTLVVPATVPDDFSGVDWSTTPWEITVNIFDVR